MFANLKVYDYQKDKSTPVLHQAKELAIAGASHLCAYCRTKVGQVYDIDHIVPLARRGTNDSRNLQVLCPTCNRRKAAKHPNQFARELGLLL
jgi:5-methylcytosine-specific restriction endonuclease McrA